MSKIPPIYRLLLPLLFLAAVPLRAQTVKAVAVSSQASYTDHISLSEDSRDMDIMVKFVFDEPKNVLTVSVLSYRSLFVFREAARYKTVVRHNRLRPDRLPYVAEADHGVRFKLSRALRKAIPRPRNEYVFKRWIEYDGLQPVPTDYKMVNDYIEQSFDIVQKRNTVGIVIRDIYLLEPDGKNYELLRGRDLNAQYVVRILRSPCFGQEEEIAAATQLAADAKQAWEGFHKTYGSGEVGSKEALATFEQTRQLLLTQFPPRQSTSQCPDVLDALGQYKQYVDSIGALTCTVKAPEAGGVDELGNSKTADSKLLYSQARQLDKAVARWLVSKDELEKADLVKQCRDIIQDMNAYLQGHPAVDAEQQKAVRVYRQAESYFKKTCGK